MQIVFDNVDAILFHFLAVDPLNYIVFCHVLYHVLGYTYCIVVAHMYETSSESLK